MTEVHTLSPRAYIDLLRSGEQIDAENYDLSQLVGRLCRGKEPRHFSSLGAGGKTCFMLGADGLRLFLEAAGCGENGAPLEMLLRIGYDIVDIYEKLVEGFVFDLCVWERRDSAVNARKADWEGVCEVISKDFPLAAEAMKLHLDRLKADGSGVENPAGFEKLQAEYGQEVGLTDYTFAKGKHDPLSYKALTQPVSAAAIRKFLFDNVGLNELYGGKGVTRLADGSDGITEYLGLAVARSAITSLHSTALGAPTLEESLQRMSRTYEALQREVDGRSGKNALDGWMTREEARSMFEHEEQGAAGKERVYLTPRECASRFLLNKPLDAHTQRLDGVGFRVCTGSSASAFCTLGGPREWGREVVSVGPPSEVAALLRRLASSQHQCMDLLLDVSWPLVHIFRQVQAGNTFRLLLVRWRPWSENFPDSTADKEQFPATRAGVIAFCRARNRYPAVAEAIEHFGDEVCKPLTQAEHDAWQLCGKGSDTMSYHSFVHSERGLGEVRQFVYQTLGLRAGWSGSGACKKYFSADGGVDAGVPTYLARNRDLTELQAEEVAEVALGAPRMEDVVTRLKQGVQELRTRLR